VTFQVPEGLKRRELHFGYAAWNYQTYLGGNSTFGTEWVFYSRNAELMRLRFGNNGQYYTGADVSRTTMPPFAAFQMDPALYFGDGGDPSNLPLLSSFSPSLNPDSIYWPVQNSTTPLIQAGIFTAPFTFRGDFDRVTVEWESGVNSPWVPNVNTAGTGWVHFVLAIVSKI
jgi:hypothetical protein